MKITGHKLKKQREGISQNAKLTCGTLKCICAATKYFC